MLLVNGNYIWMNSELKQSNKYIVYSHVTHHIGSIKYVLRDRYLYFFFIVVAQIFTSSSMDILHNCSTLLREINLWLKCGYSTTARSVQEHRNISHSHLIVITSHFYVLIFFTKFFYQHCLFILLFIFLFHAKNMLN